MKVSFYPRLRFERYHMRTGLLLAVCTVAAPAAAQIVPPITVGVTGGTLGIGPEVSYSVNPFVAVRASATFLSVHGHGHSGGYRYSGTGHISNFGGTIDVYPLSQGLSGFRISAGARSVEHNRIRFTGQATTTRSYSGVTYTPDQAGTISGTIRAKSVAPLVSIGYARRLAGVTFGIDGGVMFHGTPRVNDFTPTGQLATNSGAQSEYQNQQSRIRNDVDDYKYYPVVQLSLGYRF